MCIYKIMIMINISDYDMTSTTPFKTIDTTLGLAQCAHNIACAIAWIIIRKIIYI
jgi:hypothetical protein